MKVMPAPSDIVKALLDLEREIEGLEARVIKLEAFIAARRKETALMAELDAYHEAEWEAIDEED